MSHKYESVLTEYHLEQDLWYFGLVFEQLFLSFLHSNVIFSFQKIQDTSSSVNESVMTHRIDEPKKMTHQGGLEN